MLNRRPKKFALAACLSLALAFAYQSFAGARLPIAGAPAAGVAGAEAVLHGKSVARFGGYALNIAFTPDGKILCFDISAAPARKDPAAPKA